MMINNETTITINNETMEQSKINFLIMLFFRLIVACVFPQNASDKLNWCSRVTHKHRTVLSRSCHAHIVRCHCHGTITTITLRKVNTLELNPNVLSITLFNIKTRIITYDYNNEGARTREVDLARRRTIMLLFIV